MNTVLGCIADDFTGATDTAGLLARSGVKVSLRMGVSDTAPSEVDTTAFEVISFKSRTAPVAETRAALKWLQGAGATRFLVFGAVLDNPILEYLGQPQTKFISGDQPTKEMPLHTAFYDTRNTGAVVHLHSCHSVAMSILPDTDPDNMLPPLTAYGVMKLGKVALLPYFMLGDPAMGDAVRGLPGKRSAIVLAHHGPVVAGKDLEAACYATEELEETAKLALMTRGMTPTLVNEAQIQGLVTNYNVEWD